MIKSGIYCIENIRNGKKYIGQSINIYYRWKKHKSELNNNTHDNDYLQKAWNKYGSDIFKFYVLEFCEIDQLNDREIYYIDLYDTLNRDKGYNLMSGGGVGRKSSPEICEKIRQALIGHEVSDETRKKVSEHHSDVSGTNNPMYGKHHSDDARRKVSEANKGRVSAKRNLTPVRCIDLNVIFNDATEAGKALGLHGGLILQCCYGNRKTTGGHSWEFIKLENNIN